ncbi:septum site-determining protein MinC [Peribacillus kribbensis]|uniref:septum site-determining protein MinC n=1 Tax=Peribacillus kribbensis TaxID=356658 RepID=UPI000411153E|nr:septum site-determining protein MinC [Peribacillus kribbensis]
MSNKLLPNANVIIKGTKEGLTLHLDDSCSFDMLLEELEAKLSANMKAPENKPSISVRVHTGYRYLTEQQESRLRDIIAAKKTFKIEGIQSNVITIDEAKSQREASEITSMAAVIRSGQVIEVPGDLLLIGDVNPGGQVSAGGNIFILGALKGIAHAGKYGKLDSVIAASVMKPSQIRIGDYLNGAPEPNSEEQSGMECAYVDNGQIIIDRLQILKRIRPNLNRFEGGF